MPRVNVPISSVKKLFLELGVIDNPSKEEEKMAEVVSGKLKDMGHKVKMDEHKNLFARLDGEGERVFLNAHLDSVPPCIDKQPQFDGEYFRSNGKTVLGGDNLVGVTAILSALHYLHAKKIPHRPLDIIFTSQEEIGGDGIKHFDFSHIDAEYGIVTDALSAIGTIVMQTPTKYNFTLTIRGIAKHGGYTTGSVSAIKKAADIIQKLPLGKIRENVYLNLGKINGGKAVNTVPGEVELAGGISVFAEGDLRGGSKQECVEIIDMMVEEIQKIDRQYPTEETTLDYHIVRDGYIHRPDHPAVVHVKEAISAAGIAPVERISKGVSDANTFNSMGRKALLIGTGVEEAHTVRERVKLEDIHKLAEILVHFCTQIRTSTHKER